MLPVASIDANFSQSPRPVSNATSLVPSTRTNSSSSDALYDPPRLMVSEATLDVPSATTTPGAEPQQGASSAHTTPAPTAASDMLPEPSQEGPDSHSTAGKAGNDHHAGNPTSPTGVFEPQTADNPSDSAGNPTPNDSGSDTSPNTAGSTTPNDAESNDSSNTGDGPSGNDANTSKSHTAMMESQTPELVAGSQGDGSSTAASGSVANGAPTDAQSDGTRASASSSGTSAGVSLVFNVWSYATFAFVLLLSYCVW